MLFHFKRPLLGCQVVVHAYLEPSRWDTVRSVIASQDEIVLADTHIQFDRQVGYFTLMGEPHHLLNALLTSANFMVEIKNHAEPDLICFNLFVISGVYQDELKAYERMLTDSASQQLDLRIYRNPKNKAAEACLALFPDPGWLADLNECGCEKQTTQAIHLVIGYGVPHLFLNLTFNTRREKIVQQFSKDLEPEFADCLDYYWRGIFRPEHQASQIMFEIPYCDDSQIWILFHKTVAKALSSNLYYIGAEVVGCIPRLCLLEAGQNLADAQQIKEILPESELIQLAIMSMGLDTFGKFDSHQLYETHLAGLVPSFREQSLQDFCRVLSLGHRAPGGGSAAAYNAAMAASLVTMVIQITLSKKKYDHLHHQYTGYGRKLQVIHRLLMDSIDLDAEVLSILLKNGKILASEAESDQEKRKQILQQACITPLEVIKICTTLAEIVIDIAQECNPSAISDLGLAAHLIHASAFGSRYNILINQSFIKSKTEDPIQSEVEQLLQFIDKICADINRTVTDRISGN